LRCSIYASSGDCQQHYRTGCVITRLVIKSSQRHPWELPQLLIQDFRRKVRGRDPCVEFDVHTDIALPSPQSITYLQTPRELLVSGTGEDFLTFVSGGGDNGIYGVRHRQTSAVTFSVTTLLCCRHVQNKSNTVRTNLHGSQHCG